MIVVALLAIVIAFICFALVGWALWLILSTLLTGLFIGALARLIIPGQQPIGVFGTIVSGLAGAAIGTIIGQVAGIVHWGTVLIEIGAAVVVVAVWSRQVKRRPKLVGGRRVIDI